MSTNDETSAREVAAFHATPPNEKFLYINRKDATATTWTGEKLGNVRFGQPWRDNFGSTRVPITVYGVNGHRYSGTYFQSAGDYARVKHVKTCPAAHGIGQNRTRSRTARRAGRR